MTCLHSFAAPPLARWLARLALAATVSLLSTLSTAADRIEVTDASLNRAIEGTDLGITLDASFDFELPGVLEDAVNRGLALYFVVDFELYRERWWWFDRKLLSEARPFRL